MDLEIVNDRHFFNTLGVVCSLFDSLSLFNFSETRKKVHEAIALCNIEWILQFHSNQTIWILLIKGFLFSGG